VAYGVADLLDRDGDVPTFVDMPVADARLAGRLVEAELKAADRDASPVS
jgi:hypothetical protein